MPREVWARRSWWDKPAACRFGLHSWERMQMISGRGKRCRRCSQEVISW